MRATNPRRAGAAVLVATGLVAAALVAAIPAHAYKRPGATQRVSVASDGSEAVDPLGAIPIGQSSWETAIDASGRFVAFTSTAPNLVVGDANGLADVFVRDTKTNRTEIVSIASSGAPAFGPCAPRLSGGPSISANGRFVAFTSCATNLVPGDVNLTTDVFVHDRRKRTTEMVSLSSNGRQGMTPVADHSSGGGAISPDGRYVGFSSDADNLVRNDTNQSPDAFVYDRTKDRLVRISVSSAEEQANTGPGGITRGSGGVSLGNNGRFASFSSHATNLVPGDNNAAVDVFVRDLAKGTTERVSVRTGGEEVTITSGAGTIGSRSISADGRYVLINSRAANLVPNDRNGSPPYSLFDVFVHDRVLGRTERVSVGSDGREAQGESGLGSISPDGRYVVFYSKANNLVEGDAGFAGSNTTTVGAAPPGDIDVFIYDRAWGITEMLSVAPNGTEARGTCDGVVFGDGPAGESLDPVVSRGGRYVAFQSCATNLVPDDKNLVKDWFLRDRGPLVGLGGAGRAAASSSGSGPFAPGGAVGRDPDDDGMPGASMMGAELISADLVVRPRLDDLFVRIDVTRLPSVPGPGGTIAGDPRVLYGFALEVDGVRFEVRAQQAPTPASDALQPSFALFRCDGGCTEVGRVHGGLGTTGERVVISIPLEMVRASAGSRARRVVARRAFAAIGTLPTGSIRVLDELERPRLLRAR